MRSSVEQKNKKTYADYQKLKEGEPYQLINGMLVKSTSPTVNHQRIVKRIVRKLQLLEEKGSGEMLHAPIDVHLSDTEVYQPDIVFVSARRLSIIGEKNISGAPDLVIEVLSPATAYYDLRHKRSIYEQHGVNEYWIVDPMEKTIEVQKNSSTGFRIIGKAREKDTMKSESFPEFSMDVDSIFT